MVRRFRYAPGQESTPIVVDGVIYVTTAWSKVYAYDAKTGSQLWKFDPNVPGEWAVNACCDVVNRGVAAWNGKVYLGTIDGRLIAISAADGKVAWDVSTIEKGKPYSITGAPRVVKGLVLIGQGGAEFTMRGYISAYDAETGALKWRWYTVPGDPSKPFENPQMEMAAKTWSGDWYRKGGGGTVWDAITYDPKTDLLFVGVGNGGPWPAEIRDPGGKGDHLFLSSIVALKPDTGEYVWHYQEVQRDSWDYTAVQQITVADLDIDGKKRHVIMQAPKDGYFYVLDAASGELISAKPIVPLNWSTGIDMKTGSDLISAMKHADDTAFYCYRAIESLRHHCAATRGLTDSERARQWEKFREVAGCSETSLRQIEAAGTPLRHGELSSVTSKEREQFFISTWDIVEAYLKSA